jgi:hypothetical protein
VEDFMGEKFKNISLAIGEIIIALWTVVTLLLDISGLGSTNHDLRVFALVGFVIFVVLVLFHIISQNNKLYSITPNIIIWDDPDGENPYVNDVYLQKTRPSQISQSGQFRENIASRMAHVRFANCPKNGTNENKARNVAATITFYDMKGNILLKSKQGRWSDTDDPSKLTRADKVAILNMDFPPNCTPRGLDLVVKYKGEEEWYFYNNDNYFFENWIDDKHKISEKTVISEVHLIGERVNSKFRFVLHNEGKGGDIVIRKEK